MDDNMKFNNLKENNLESKNNAEGIIIIIAFLVVLIFGVRFVVKLISPPTNKDIENIYEDVYTDSYTDGLDVIDTIISDLVVDEETQTITSGLYKYEFSSHIPENYKDIIRKLHEEVGISYQTYFIYDEKDGEIFVLLDSCEEYYMTVD